jgi:hypothetical protein
MQCNTKGRNGFVATSSATYHEPLDKLSSTTQDVHRALVSLQEELEAVDWYGQRAEACEDAELKAILLHNMREEIEHAAMVLEWLRRRVPDFNRHLRTYLFQDTSIVDREDVATAAETGAPAPSPRRLSLTVGTMKED